MKALSALLLSDETLRMHQFDMLSQGSLRGILVLTRPDLADIIFMDFVSHTPQLLLSVHLGRSLGVHEALSSHLSVCSGYCKFIDDAARAFLSFLGLLEVELQGEGELLQLLVFLEVMVVDNSIKNDIRSYYSVLRLSWLSFYPFSFSILYYIPTNNCLRR